MSHSRQHRPVANRRPLGDKANDSIYRELRHRGEALVAYPGVELW